MAETGGSSYRRPVRAMLFCYFAENRTGVCLPAIRGLVGTLAFSTCCFCGCTALQPVI